MVRRGHDSPNNAPSACISGVRFGWDERICCLSVLGPNLWLRFVNVTVYVTSVLASLKIFIFNFEHNCYVHFDFSFDSSSFEVKLTHALILTSP